MNFKTSQNIDAILKINRKQWETNHHNRFPQKKQFFLFWRIPIRQSPLQILMMVFTGGSLVGFKSEFSKEISNIEQNNSLFLLLKRLIIKYISTQNAILIIVLLRMLFNVKPTQRKRHSLSRKISLQKVNYSNRTYF